MTHLLEIDPYQCFERKYCLDHMIRRLGEVYYTAAGDMLQVRKAVAFRSAKSYLLFSGMFITPHLLFI